MRTLKIIGKTLLIVIGVTLCIISFFIVENRSQFKGWFGGGLLMAAAGFRMSIPRPRPKVAVQEDVMQPEQPRRKRNRFVSILLWTLGIVAALFVVLGVIGACSDDEQEQSDGVEIENFDENRSALLLGGTDSRLMAMSVKLTKNVMILDSTVYAFDADGERYGLNVEERGPGHYLLRADGKPGVWGAQVFDLTLTTDKDGKIALAGTFEDTAGPEEQVEFIIMQEKDDNDSRENYYIGKIGEYSAFMDVTVINHGTGESTGNIMIVGEDTVSIPVTITNTGSDEYGDPIYSVSGPDMSMKLTAWSNGGEYGYSGEAYISGETVPVSFCHNWY